MSKNKELQVYEELILNVLTQIEKDHPLKKHTNKLAWNEFRKHWKNYNNVRKEYVVVEVESNHITFNTDKGDTVTIQRSSWSDKCSRIKRRFNSSPEETSTKETSKQFTLHHDLEILELKARVKVLEQSTEVLEADRVHREDIVQQLQQLIKQAFSAIHNLQECNAKIGDKIAAKPWHEGHEPQGDYEHYEKLDKPQYDPELRYTEVK